MEAKEISRKAKGKVEGAVVSSYNSSLLTMYDDLAMKNDLGVRLNSHLRNHTQKAFSPLEKKQSKTVLTSD